jgi:hypothetical protein
VFQRAIALGLHEAAQRHLVAGAIADTGITSLSLSDAQLVTGFKSVS